MITSYTRDFVFLPIRKTASTSVEIVLGSWCGPADVVTPIGVDDEILRRPFGGGPRNFSTDPGLEERYRAALATEDPTRITPIYKREIMHNLRFLTTCPRSSRGPCSRLRSGTERSSSQSSAIPTRRPCP